MKNDEIHTMLIFLLFVRSLAAAAASDSDWMKKILHFLCSLLLWEKREMFKNNYTENSENSHKWKSSTINRQAKDNARIVWDEGKKSTAEAKEEDWVEEERKERLQKKERWEKEVNIYQWGKEYIQQYHFLCLSLGWCVRLLRCRDFLFSFVRM